eukprot:265047_1
MILLFFIVRFINIIECYQCRLYVYTSTNYGGIESGPFDAGQHYPLSVSDIQSMKIYAEGYTCHVKLYQNCCNCGTVVDRTAGPFQMASDSGFFIPALPHRGCADIWSYATPK